MTNFVTFNPLNTQFIISNVEFGKILEKNTPIETLRTYCDICFAKRGRTLPCCCRTSLIVCAKKSGVSSFFNVTKDF
jgi:hypothetical protein